MSETTSANGNKKNKRLVPLLVIVLILLLLVLAVFFLQPVKQFVFSQTDVSGRVFLTGLNLSDVDTSQLVVQARKHGKQDFTDLKEVKLENGSPWSWNAARKGGNYDFRAHIAIEDEPLVYSNIVTATAPAIDEGLYIDVNHEHLPESIKEEVLAAHGDFADMEGGLDIHGYIPDGSYIDLYAKTIDGEEYELVQSRISPAPNSHWQWTGATPGLRYSLQARLIDSDGNIVGESQILNVSAPAYGQYLRVQSNAVVGDGAGSHATTGETVVSRKAGVSGSIDLNGSVKDDSRIGVLWRYLGETDYKVAFDIPAKDGQTWNWSEAQAGGIYEMAVCLLEGSDCKVTSHFHQLTAPAHNVQIKINTGLPSHQDNLGATQPKHIFSKHGVVTIPSIPATKKSGTKSSVSQPHTPSYMAAATKICKDAGGTMGYKKTSTGSEYRACTFKDGHVCSAKALADSSCKPVSSKAGTSSSGNANVSSSSVNTQAPAPQVPSNSYTNPAAQACISHGGTTTQDSSNGTCSLPNGTSCLNSAVFQNGKCSSGSVPASNILQDADMEAGGTSAWRQMPGISSTITKEPGTRTGGSGSQVLRIAASTKGLGYGGSTTQANPTIVQSIVKQGVHYKLTGYARGDGTSNPRFFVGGVQWLGTTSTSWQPIDFEFYGAGSLVGFSTIIHKNIGLVSGQYSEWDDLSITEVNP